MINHILTIVLGVYLAAMAIIDKKRKEIPVLPGAVCFVCIAAGQAAMGTPWRLWIPGIVVGAALYGISKGSRGAVGEGDALVYALTGALLGLMRNIEVLLLSLFLCSAASLWLLLARRVGKHDRIAFIPFTAVAYGMVVLL